MAPRKKSKHILLIIFDYIGYFRKVNWAKEYLKLQEANFKLQEANFKIQEAKDKINKKLNEDLLIEKDLRIAEARKIVNLEAELVSLF